MNDQDNLYLAIRFLRSAADPGNTATFEFDNDGVPPRENGDDLLSINPNADFIDLFRTNEPPCEAGHSAPFCGFNET